MPLPSHKVTICGIPELPLHSMVGISHVLSIIDTHEPRPAALDDYFEIEHLHDVLPGAGLEAGILRHHVVEADQEVLEFGERVHAQPESHVLVHCHAGISRSTAAAAILMCQHAPGHEEEAFLKLLGMRKHGWPNTRMVEFADDLLKRDGAMLRGLVSYRKALLKEKPHLSEVVRNIGRGHELPA